MTGIVVFAVVDAANRGLGTRGLRCAPAWGENSCGEREAATKRELSGQGRDVSLVGQDARGEKVPGLPDTHGVPRYRSP